MESVLVGKAWLNLPKKVQNRARLVARLVKLRQVLVCALPVQVPKPAVWLPLLRRRTCLRQVPSQLAPPPMASMLPAYTWWPKKDLVKPTQKKPP